MTEIEYRVRRPSVVLRGSFASGEEQPWSDVDVVILPPGESISDQAAAALLEASGVLELARGRQLDVMVVTPTELGVSHLVRRPLQAGRLLAGPPVSIPDPIPGVWVQQAALAADYILRKDRSPRGPASAVLWAASASLVCGGWPVPSRKAYAARDWPDDQWASVVRTADSDPSALDSGAVSAFLAHAFDVMAR